MSLLPDIKNIEDYKLIYRNIDTWIPAMKVICERHNLDVTKLEFAPPGSHVVFKVNPDRYIKLFLPLWHKDFISERLVLGKLSGRSELLIPRLIAEGEIENWQYIIMTAVEGLPLYNAWNLMNMSDRERIVVHCGEFMASLHSTQIEGFDAISIDWHSFVERQIQSCIACMDESDMSKDWIQSVKEFLKESLFEQNFQPVLLNADITDEHVLVRRYGERWELAGFIDFGDAMLGHPYYEFAATGCTITRSSSNLQKAMLLAYGFSKDQLDSELAMQLMAYILIHRFINIPDLLGLFNSHQPANFEELIKEFWCL